MALLGQWSPAPPLLVDPFPPSIPAAARASAGGARYVDLPPGYSAPLYRSPTDGLLVADLAGGARLEALGTSFDDGNATWQLVRDREGHEAWVADLFLSDAPPSTEPPGEEDYLGPVFWDGEIAYCVNPAGGPPGLSERAFAALVERAAARWQRAASGRLPLAPRGLCQNDPAIHSDGMSTIGWVDDLGLVIAAQTWPDVEQGTAGEMDIQLSRGYFVRLLEREPVRPLRGCVLSTLVHELGHLLGLQHPRSRLLPSSMQGVGAARCDKGQPTASDAANLRRRYGPALAADPPS